VSEVGRRRLVLALPLAVALAGTAACSDDATTWPSWSSQHAPPGSGVVEVADLGTSGDGWVASGAIEDGQSRSPAVWRTQGDDWQALPMVPVSYYGERAVLYDVATSDGQLVAVGWASGGAHGNPRTATWWSGGESVDEQVADFEVFGGPRAIDVVDLLPAAGSWIILGNRSNEHGRPGGALWRAADGRAFALVPMPPLASEGDETVRVNGAVDIAGGQLVAVGERAVPGRDDQPIAWSSADGQAWHREDVAELVPDNAQLARSLARVAATPTHAVALGIEDEGPRQTYRSAVRDATGRWRLGESFAETPNDELPRIGALAAVGERVVALVKVAGEYELWWSDNGTDWTKGKLPEPVAADSFTTTALAGDERELLLAVTDAEGAHLWSARR
jgi:hypothetical protein